MTQEELAGELNVTRQALSNWERDVNEPDLNMLKKICFLFYRTLANAQEIIEQKNYDPVSDLENTPNSVFCSHGAGHTVTWDKVPETAHYPYTYPLK